MTFRPNKRADAERWVAEAKERVRRADRELSQVYDEIRALHPDGTGKTLDDLARALTMAQARLEIAKVRLPVVEADLAATP